MSGAIKNEWTILLTEDAEKVELLNTFFSSVFPDQTSCQESLVQETSINECWKEDFSLVQEDWVRIRKI